jgi:hypothetical protein
MSLSLSAMQVITVQNIAMMIDPSKKAVVSVGSCAVNRMTLGLETKLSDWAAQNRAVP